MIQNSTILKDCNFARRHGLATLRTAPPMQTPPLQCLSRQRRVQRVHGHPPVQAVAAGATSLSLAIPVVTEMARRAMVGTTAAGANGYTAAGKCPSNDTEIYFSTACLQLIQAEGSRLPLTLCAVLIVQSNALHT